MTPAWGRGRRVVMLTLDVPIDARLERTARALGDEGFDVVIVAPDGKAMHEPRFELERVPVGRALPRRVRRLARTALLAARRVDMSGFEHAFYRRALARRPDIVHVDQLPLLRAGVALRRGVGARLVYDMRDWYPELPWLTDAQRKLLRSRERTHIGAADARITVNPLLADAIARAYGVEVASLSLAFDPPPGLHDTRHDLFRSELGIAQDVRIVLYQGLLAPERNLEQLVDAVALAASPVELVLMGYGDYGDDLRRRAAARGVEGRVHFVAARPRYDFLRWTASADVGLIPYSARRDLNTRYCSPNKLYEYVAARLPILSNELPFVRSVVEGNGFGVVADLETAERFAQALDAFPYSRREEFGRNLAERGAEFTWARERPKLLELYREVLKSG